MVGLREALENAPDHEDVIGSVERTTGVSPSRLEEEAGELAGPMTMYAMQKATARQEGGPLNADLAETMAAMGIQHALAWLALGVQLAHQNRPDAPQTPFDAPAVPDRPPPRCEGVEQAIERATTALNTALAEAGCNHPAAVLVVRAPDVSGHAGALYASGPGGPQEALDLTLTAVKVLTEQMGGSCRVERNGDDTTTAL